MSNPDASAPTEGLEYILQWQVLLCALILLLPAAIALVLISKRFCGRGGGGSPLRKSDFWDTCWKNLHPRWLLLYRASAFLAMTFFLYQISAAFGISAFYFYTQWTFLLVTIYFLLGSIVSARACCSYKTKPGDQTGEKDVFLDGDTQRVEYSEASASGEKKRTGFIKLDYRCNSNANEQLGFLDNLLLAIYQTCAGAVMLSDIVFWGLLLPFMVDEDFKLTPLIGTMHAVNAIFLIIDSAMNRLPCDWFGLTYFILWSCSYVIFQWILHSCCVSWWPYPFLELSTPSAPLWYLALALVHLPCYESYVLLTKAKHKVFPKWFPRSFVRSR